MELIKRMREHCGEVLSWADFVRMALYEPELGYYRRSSQRVGKGAESDFYTASSIGSVFGELFGNAAQTLLGEDFCAGATLVELGAEPEGSGLVSAASAFKEYLPLRIGDELVIPEKAIVVSNELLDAQPFERLQVLGGKWRQMAVTINDDLSLQEVASRTISPELLELIEDLPQTVPDGLRLDIALEAESLLQRISTQQWEGGLFMFDYGKRLDELLGTSPLGTARAYYQHEASSDLLAQPGQQDLTCHVCWDRLERVLTRAGFSSVTTQPQESFLVKNAQIAMQSIVEAAGVGINLRKQELMALISPQHFGQKFQVLSAQRLTPSE